MKVVGFPGSKPPYSYVSEFSLHHLRLAGVALFSVLLHHLRREVSFVARLRCEVRAAFPLHFL